MAFNFRVGTRGPLSSLETNDGKTTEDNSIDFYDGVKSSPVHVSFPNDLEQIDHWITFRAFETKHRILQILKFLTLLLCKSKIFHI